MALSKKLASQIVDELVDELGLGKTRDVLTRLTAHAFRSVKHMSYIKSLQYMRNACAAREPRK